MARCNKISKLLLISLALAILMVDHETTAQTIPECANDLLPCEAYLNTTKAPEECCKPLREAVKNQKDCICDFYNFYNNHGLIQPLGVNITQAFELAKRCGVTADISVCSNAPAPKSTGLPSTPSTPQGVPGRDENNADNIAWIGVCGLLLFWVSILSQ